MNKKKLLLFIIPLSLSVISCQQQEKNKQYEPGNDLTLTSIEMRGQYGDATLIQYGDYDFLIDSGAEVDAPHVNEVLLDKVKDKTIDMLVITHPHGDHIGGIINGGLHSLNISTIVDYGYTYVTTGNGAIENSEYVSYYTNWRNEQIAKGAKYYAIVDALKEIPTVTISKEDDCYIKWLKNDYYVAKNVVFPNSNVPTDNPNTTSVSCVLQYKYWNILLCGDADSSFAEMSIMTNQEKLFSDQDKVILKATHHGSMSSMGGSFLDWCHPDLIYISAALVDGVCVPNQVTLGTGEGEQNHPNKSAVKRMENRLDKIYWNAINGDLTIKIDGVNDPSVSGVGRVKNYLKVDGEPASIETEKNVTLLQSEFYKYYSKR